jgi:hypothetical protein
MSAYIKENKSILDFGYGNGSFLKLCKNAFDKRYGFDVSQYAIDDSDIEILKSPFNKEFDVVAFFDSVEHLSDITEIFKIKTKYFVFSIPYCHFSFLENEDWFFNKYKHLRPDEHLFHFNPDSLERFMNSNGYETVLKNSSVEDIIRTRYEKERQNIFTAIYKATI